MNPRQQRLCGIQLAAALIFACTMLNISLFVGLLDELWTESLKQQYPRFTSSLLKDRVCVLIPGDSAVWNVTLPSLAASVRGETEFDYGVYVVMMGNRTAETTKWFRQHFPPESTLEFVSLPVGFNGSVTEMLLQESSDGCSFHFIVGSHTTFLSPGWARALIRALQRLHPPYVGAVSPVGCKECIFVRALHRELFSRRRHFRHDDECWAEWVRSVYGACRVTDVAGAAVSSSRDASSCSANKSTLFLDLVMRGRLFVSKFLSLNSF